MAPYGGYVAFGNLSVFFYKPPPVDPAIAAHERWREWVLRQKSAPGLEALDERGDRYLTADEKIVIDDPEMRRMSERFFRQARMKAARGCYATNIYGEGGPKKGLGIEVGRVLADTFERRGGVRPNLAWSEVRHREEDA